MSNTYVVKNNKFVNGTNDKPMPMTPSQAFEYVMESSRTTAELIRSNWDDATGNYNRLYIDKEGNEYWTTKQTEKVPTLH